MKEKPILFSTPMVQAILDGRKTMTRRVIKLPDGMGGKPVGEAGNVENPLGFMYPCGIKRPKYQPGDILWVRETWTEMHDAYFYRADAAESIVALMEPHGAKWRPSIFMPREAARIRLRVTAARPERVQEITEADAIKEGVPTDWPMEAVYCPICRGEGLVGAAHPVTLGYMEVDCPHCYTAVKRFRNLWNSLNAKRGYGWDVNPWVWAYTFERVATQAGEGQDICPSCAKAFSKWVEEGESK